MWTSTRSVANTLAEKHYLGSIKRGVAWADQYGIIVVSAPTSRRLPANRWLELCRWCITSEEKNAGSRQWAAFVRALRTANTVATTVVSYSDPSMGHTGALYRACNFLWAPTWHRLRPPPTGNGSWGNDKAESVKDRWVFPIREDEERERLLLAGDDSILKKYPWAAYKEPGGVPFKRWREECQTSATRSMDGAAA